MLTSIRSAFSKGIMRIFLIALMSVLVLSFAIWGIGDVIRGGTNTTIAKIGKEAISAQEFQTQYTREQRLLAQNMQRPMTTAELAQIGLDKLVLQRMITDKVLDLKVAQLGLNISDEAVIARIQNSTVFKTNGAFDKFKFNEMTRELGFTESGYIDLERKLALRQHLATLVGGLGSPPNQIIEAAHIYNSQKRIADFVVLTAKEAGSLNAPSAEDLAKFYESKKANFRAPEYRKATIVTLTPQTIADKVSISEDDVKAKYEALKINLTEPEKRELERLNFQDKAKAASASAALKAGKTFEEVAKENDIAEASTKYGTYALNEIIDKTVATAAFALKENGISDPIDTPFGTVILRLKSVKASVTKPYGDVAAFIRSDMEKDRSRVVMGDMHDKFEKERSTGLPIGEIAEKIGLKPLRIVAIDPKGLDKNGVEVKLTGDEMVLKEIFDTNINVERDSLRLKDNGGDVWVEVNEITPSRERALDEVKAAVTAAYFEQETATILKDNAAKIVKEVETGKSLLEAAKAYGLTPITSKELTRFTPDVAFSSAALQSLFQTPKGKAATTAANLPAEQIVFVVKEVVTPVFEKTTKENADLTKQLTKSYEDDLLLAFIEQLKKETKVSIDEAMFKRAVGNKVESN